jgi:hypothetical protein
MPGTTPLHSIPYPLLTEGVDSISVKNLADAVDALLNGSLTTAVSYTKRPAALVKRDTGTQSFASGAALASVTYTTEHYDSNGIGNLGTNNERLTIQTAGVYLLAASWTISSSNNEDVQHAHATITVNGTVVSGRKYRFPEEGGSVACVKRMNVADIVRQQFTWTGINSPKNLVAASLGARWICSL